MRILYVSHYFPPEMGAPAGRVSGLARQWALAGHEVHVLTGFPHHPTGKIHPDYKRAFRRGFVREQFAGATVHRTWIFPAANKGKVLRSLNYASFMASAAVMGSLRVPRPDVIIATSPQLLCAAAGWLLARRFRAPLVMEVRDLWPESLVAVGASEYHSPVVSLLEALARRLYRSAQRIVTVTDAQRAAIVAGGIAAERVSVVPNGVDEGFLEVAAQAGEGAAPRSPFIVTYIGTLGMAHHLETLLEAAQMMREDAGVHFRLVGEGARRATLQSRAREMKLTNVEFAGERPRAEVPRWIAESDACAVLLRKTPVFQTVVPSKMLEIMAAARPIILGVEGEARALLNRARAGVAIEPQNAADLVAAIRLLQSNPDHARQLGANGRAFVRNEFARGPLAARYLTLLKAVAGVESTAVVEKSCVEVEATSPRET